MKLDLKSAYLIRRYKRFLADITLPSQEVTTIHCANTGAMTGCAEPDDIVWYSTSDNPKRKYPYSWEITQTKNGNNICVNTLRANQLTEEALLASNIKELTDFDSLKREVAYGNEKSKIDFLLLDSEGRKTYVEVKSVTLLQQEQGYFPDAVTTRGQKHLRELMQLVDDGHRAVLLFAVLHSGINSVQAAAHVDPTYATLLKEAFDHGVEVLTYKAEFTQMDGVFEIELNHAISINL